MSRLECGNKDLRSNKDLCGKKDLCGIAKESDRKMRIIRSLVERVGGELRIDRRDNNQGARFAVLFS